MLTRVKKYNRLPFIINKMEKRKKNDISVSKRTKEKKKERATDIPLRKGTLDNVFAPKT